MDGRILGSVFFLLRVMATGLGWLQMQQFRTFSRAPSSTDWIYQRQDTLALVSLVVWFGMAIGFHFDVFMRGRNSALRKWLERPEGAGVLAVMGIAWTVPSLAALGVELIYRGDAPIMAGRWWDIMANGATFICCTVTLVALWSRRAQVENAEA